MKKLYAGCRAYVFPGMEDFGISPLEAQASGRPVIAYGKGGALESVVPGVTGEFFSEQTVECLIETLGHFDDKAYNSTQIRLHAEQFDTSVFKHKIAAFIDEKLAEVRG